MIITFGVGPSHKNEFLPAHDFQFLKYLRSKINKTIYDIKTKFTTVISM